MSCVYIAVAIESHARIQKNQLLFVSCLDIALHEFCFSTTPLKTHHVLKGNHTAVVVPWLLDTVSSKTASIRTCFIQQYRQKIARTLTIQCLSPRGAQFSDRHCCYGQRMLGDFLSFLCSNEMFIASIYLIFYGGFH